MKKIIFKSLILCSVFGASLPVLAEQFIDCSDGSANCDVLYAADDIFVAEPARQVSGNLQTDDLVKTTNKPLAESRPVNALPAGDTNGYRVVLPKGATLSSGADSPVPGAVVVPGRRSNSRVDILPDGSVQTTTVEVTTEPTAEGYQETTRRIERLDTEKQGAVWVEKSLAEKVDYGDGAHDWEAPKGETLRSLLMQWGEVSGWTVVWKLDKDYKLEAGVVFRGTFTEVASAIIRTFARAVPAPIGTFYKGNRVLVVSVQEDENAH